jgi:hypothetical protein
MRERASQKLCTRLFDEWWSASRYAVLPVLKPMLRVAWAAAWRKSVEVRLWTDSLKKL